jgi:hypothetical protein
MPIGAHARSRRDPRRLLIGSSYIGPEALRIIMRRHTRANIRICRRWVGPGGAIPPGQPAGRTPPGTRPQSTADRLRTKVSCHNQDAHGDGLNPLGGKNRGHRVTHDSGPAGLWGVTTIHAARGPQAAGPDRPPEPPGATDERIHRSQSASPPRQQAPAADAGTASRPRATVACAAVQ